MSVSQERLLASMGIETPGAKMARQTAERLRAARLHVGLTQREIAETMGTSQAQVVRIENAQVLGISLRSLADFAGACGYEARIILVPEGED